MSLKITRSLVQVIHLVMTRHNQLKLYQEGKNCFILAQYN